MPQAELAALVGVSTQQLGKYERGENRIAVGRHEEIMRILDEEPHGFGENSAPPYEYSSDQVAMLRRSLQRIREELIICEEIASKL